MSNPFTTETLLAIAGSIIVILTAIGLIHRMLLLPAFREINGFIKWMKKFQRDWDGEEEEPGRDAVPGVMERLNRIDGELQRNGGSSLKDKVVRVSESLDTLNHRVNDIESRQCDIQKMIVERVDLPNDSK